MRADYHDLAIEQLTDDEAGRREQIVDLLLARDEYRRLAQQAVHALHALTVERERLRASHHRLIDEYRYLRERVMRGGRPHEPHNKRRRDPLRRP